MTVQKNVGRTFPVNYGGLEPTEELGLLKPLGAGVGTTVGAEREAS